MTLQCPFSALRCQTFHTHDVSGLSLAEDSCENSPAASSVSPVWTVQWKHYKTAEGKIINEFKVHVFGNQLTSEKKHKRENPRGGRMLVDSFFYKDLVNISA